MMRKFILMFFVFIWSVTVFGQTTITGKVVDAKTMESLPGATVTTEDGSKGTISGMDGKFQMNVPEGEKVKISFIGYVAQVLDAKPNMGIIKLKPDAVGLSEVRVISSVAVDRQTPVAVANIKSKTIENRVGNQEFPEIMKTTPSVYATKQGGGYGDARINIRGFDQSNVAVMINGVPVNDMENGWVYWSNWAGLTDVASTIQIQRGLGASKLAVPSVGGSINIITNAAEIDKAVKAGVSLGNDAYQKYSIMLSTGLMDNGWAITAQGSLTQGDGYIDGTAFRGYSYFLGISKKLNDRHMISFTGLGAPQWHHQRYIGSYDNVFLKTYDEKGMRFNHFWGMYDGEEFSWRKNFYHKPKFYLNHYWTISDKTDLKTSAYVSLGRGGGTGPRGRINGPDGSIYDSYSGDDDKTRNAGGQVLFDDMAAWNAGEAVNTDIWGEKQPDDNFGGKYTTSSSGNGFIRRASMNEHNWMGVLTTLTHKLTDNLNVVAGFDGRYYKGMHYRKVVNLLGNDAYLSRSDINNPQNYITDPDASREDGNILGYWNDGLVSWLGLFGQVEYISDQFSAFISLSGSNQGFKRIDYFNYFDDDLISDINSNATLKQEYIDELGEDDFDQAMEGQVSDWENFFGGNLKAGINYNIDDNHNVFANTGYISRQPIFDNVFINYVNDVNEDVENQTIFAVEAGYGYRAKYARANLNVYHTKWGNRQFDKGFEITVGEEQHDALAQFENVSQLHQGVEFDFSVAPSHFITINGMASVGKWIYTENFSASITDIDANQQAGEATIYAKDLHIGDAAQTTFAAGVDIKPVDALLIYATFTYFDNLYADFDVSDDAFFNEGADVIKLPSYNLLDAGVSYRFTVSGINIIVRGNVNNLLDTKYISELETSYVDGDDNLKPLKDNKGYYGFGRTWNAGIKFEF